MNLLIVGLGSIGRRHLANLRTLEPTAHISVWHQHTKAGENLLPDALRTVYRLEDALTPRPDAAFICSPASRHIETALVLARQGVHLFIEKPLSNTLTAVNDLLTVCKQSGLTLMVGYNLRFYRPLQLVRQALIEGQIGRALSIRAEVGQFLPDWRPAQDYRQTVSARSELGGGALLELSHELDYVRWLMSEVQSVSAQVGRLSDLAIDVEDTAEITLRFRSGAIGNIHLDMVQRPVSRNGHIIGTDGTIAWDLLSQQVCLFTAEAGTWVDLHPAAALDRNEMYLAELRHFLDCVQGYNQTPLVTGEDGRRVLELVLAARRSSHEQRTIEV
ncbi:MAG: Gfo/Idh/MocA family oxidoreductase [Anaerolineae bacterium]|nr:Gfo/Idh/MocA family oxidoreductase [Anaerolineae bacterium]